MHNTSEGFPHQEIRTNRKHVLDSVTLDNLPLAVWIQEVSGNYRQGHGTRCHFNGCPQRYLVTRKTLIYVSNMCKYTVFYLKSWEPGEGIFINPSRISQSLKELNIQLLFPSDSTDANQIYHGVSRENNLRILRQSEIYLLHLRSSST